jgi:hypothetical protein
MGDAIPTIQIKVPPCPGNEAGIVTINECDFDPTRHERVGAEAAPDAKGGGHEARQSAERQRKKSAASQEEGRR